MTGVCGECGDTVDENGVTLGECPGRSGATCSTCESCYCDGSCWKPMTENDELTERVHAIELELESMKAQLGLDTVESLARTAEAVKDSVLSWFGPKKTDCEPEPPPVQPPFRWFNAKPSRPHDDGTRQYFTVGTPEEADALPVGTVIRDWGSFVYEKIDNEFTPWAAGPKLRATEKLGFSVTVIFDPRQEPDWRG